MGALSALTLADDPTREASTLFAMHFVPDLVISQRQRCT